MPEKNITASFIIEMLGRPAEHVDETMEKLIEGLGKENGVKVINKTIHEAKELEIKKEEKSKNEKNKEDVQIRQKLFTSFAEVEAEFEKIEYLMMTAFKYMPANIEIISPSNVILEVGCNKGKFLMLTRQSILCSLTSRGAPTPMPRVSVGMCMKLDAHVRSVCGV